MRRVKKLQMIKQPGSGYGKRGNNKINKKDDYQN